jgi:hypothetical protein
MAKKQDALLAMMDKDVAEAREVANAEVKRSQQKMEDELAKHQETIEESEADMADKVRFHREQIDIHKRQENIAKGLANEARATLEKISNSLKGE